MGIYSGSLVLVYLNHELDWKLIGGMRTTSFSLNSELIDSSNIANDSWRELFNGGGLKSISISISGAFSDNEAERKIRKLAFLGELEKYKISFSNGETLVGKFQISYYQRIGDFNDEELYALKLESSGRIDFF
jgi:predicted secreted protein